MYTLRSFRLIVLFMCSQIIIIANGDKPCAARNLNYDSVICVCNATYCDETSKIVKQPKGSYILYSTSRGGLRFQRSEGKFLPYNTVVPPLKKKEAINLVRQIFYNSLRDDIILTVDQRRSYQTIIGFGGGFTDSTGMLYMKLSETTKKNFVSSYFSENGIEYNMGRVPIGGTDYSTKPYAYNMYPENDISLKNFSLAEEDYLYKIPFIKDAQAVSADKMYLLGAAWSAPIWMKTNHAYMGISLLLPQYYQTWADYHLKFLQAYDKENIDFWGISTGNEPGNGLNNFIQFNSMGWLPNLQGIWIANHFGPTIHKSKFKDIRIISLDDQRYLLPVWLMALDAHADASKYVHGFGIHWYTNNAFSTKWVDVLKPHLKNKFVIGTEACLGSFEQLIIELGSWERADIFLTSIIDDLNHDYVGWIDWNLALDENGGPSWANNLNDAFIIIYPEKDEFIKQPMFYVMGHVSKFVPRGSKRIKMTQSFGAPFTYIAFKRPDGGVTVILYNSQSISSRIVIQDKRRGKIILFLPAHSVHTLVYW